MFRRKPSNYLLHKQVLRSLERGPLDACQIATLIDYPLSASDKYNKRFFQTMDELERIRMIEWKPAEEENPQYRQVYKSEGDFPYVSRVYRLRSVSLRESASGLVKAVKSFFRKAG